MRRVKIKPAATRVPVRKSALSASAASRRHFPAWIVADESGATFTARAGVTPRVRDGLVLRAVERAKVGGAGKPAAGTKEATDDHGGR